MKVKRLPAISSMCVGKRGKREVGAFWGIGDMHSPKFFHVIQAVPLPWCSPYVAVPRVEIGHYSVVHFGCITVFKGLPLRVGLIRAV